MRMIHSVERARVRATPPIMPPRFICLSTIVIVASALPAATIPMDSARGDALFQSQNCIRCHRLKGVGGQTAPDLGRILDRGYSPDELASAMWNHAPAMWSAIREAGMKAGEQIDRQAAADLFASFYAARYFETPGDAARGKRLFEQKNCAGCHGITASPDQRAKPVREWQSLAHPVALVGAMWNHAPAMWNELSKRKLPWPLMTTQDLSDLLVYLRHASGGAPAAEQAFRITSGSGGEQLFHAKGCVACHDPTKPLRSRIALTGVAASMWNHAVFLNAKPLRPEPPRIDTEEMRELLSTYWAQQFFETTGSALKGKRVFVSKRCAGCHSQNGPGPVLTARGGSWNGITMVSVLWRHGPSMLSQMKEKNISWPVFRAGEMADLMAYLNGPK